MTFQTKSQDSSPGGLSGSRREGREELPVEWGRALPQGAPCPGRGTVGGGRPRTPRPQPGMKAAGGKRSAQRPAARRISTRPAPPTSGSRGTPVPISTQPGTKLGARASAHVLCPRTRSRAASRRPAFPSPRTRRVGQQETSPRGMGAATVSTKALR